MATKHVLKAEPRQRTGSGVLKQMRREGWVPSVIYGRGSENKNLKVNAKAFSELLAFKNRASRDNWREQARQLHEATHGPLV